MNIQVIKMDIVIETAETLIERDMQLKSLDKRLMEFMINQIGHRPQSHGFAHSCRVSRYAIYISFVMAFDASVHIPVLIVSWMHDLLDGKYASEYDENYEAMRLFLKDFDYKWLKKIMDRISRSREVKYGDSDWLAEIGAEGILIRNIVSDADKLDAIGIHGIYRCLDYTREINPHLIYKEALIKAIGHIDTYLVPLFRDFLKMEVAIELARPLQIEMLDHLEGLKKKFL